jgi:ATP-dependent Lhr-like helicase
MPTKHAEHLARFHPAIQRWFSETFDQPTPPQMQGWPPIAREENTLILAPTGSGKTLTAFLVCIDQLLKRHQQHDFPQGVHTLYISPLKALNYDIERNLEAPLAGIHAAASELSLDLPEIRIAVRTGDTTQKERERMLKRPPQILITTPESLHLLLTSPRGQWMLKTVNYVIVDEIHALSENKRGTFLTLLLERLQHIVPRPFVRIGLSATQQPLAEIAHFLGGCDPVQQGDRIDFVPRPVTIIDTGLRKTLDLQIVSPVDDFRDLPENTIWPDIYQKLLELIRQHRSTLIFTNNRAAAERITAEINDLAGFELVRAHHGSVSKELRREIEQQLKQGQLPALVATGTLELGIDMGAIDLVCQVESPKDIARGLQRVGRAGHLYHLASKGRLLPKTRSDLAELAVITRAMHRGDVSPIKIPRNCLDILAQQIVAMVAMQPWRVDDLYYLVRQAYPYRHLPQAHFLGVIELVAGRYPSAVFRDLRPRISWDRVNNVLHPLPGSQRLAIMGGGAIPDTGQYGCYLEDGVTKLGELEEEFVFERRVGEVFVLGTNSWRIREITHDRVIVAAAPPEAARMPFWKGEFFHRPVHLGQLYGDFCRELTQRLSDPTCVDWLERHFSMDRSAAENLYQFFNEQLAAAGTIPDLNTILIESFQDELGDPRMVILSPYGGRLHLPWKLALLAQFKRQLGIIPESLHSDGGIVFRYPVENIDRVIQIIHSVKSSNVEELLLEELAHSAFFGIRFRHNANRAMLIPRPQPGKRSPLWLQRMRSRDLLEIAQQYPSFPIVIETYRECLQDYLAVDELKELLQRIECGDVKMVIRKASQPSPFASALMFDFMAGYMYQYDEPKPPAARAPGVPEGLIQELLRSDRVTALLDETAAQQIEQQLQGTAEGYRTRTATELVELLSRIGDLTAEEIASRVSGDVDEMLQTLSREHRALCVFIPGGTASWRWIAAEEFPLYRAAFAATDADDNSAASYQKIAIKIGNEIEWQSAADFLPGEILTQEYPKAAAQEKILTRYLWQHAVSDVPQIILRYPFDEAFVQQVLVKLQQQGQFVELPPRLAGGSGRWAATEMVERLRTVTLRRQRSQIQPCDTAQFANFLLHWQHRAPGTRLLGSEGLGMLIEKLQGLPLPAELWEHEIFARRIENYQSGWLDELCRQGEIVWYGAKAGGATAGDLAFAFREDANFWRSLAARFSPITKAESEHIAELETTGNQASMKPSAEILSLIRRALTRIGACFVSDLALDTGLAPAVCAAALWELIWLGEVTNDTFAVIRAGKSFFSLTAAQVLPSPRTPVRRYGRTHRYRPVSGAGRWSLLPASLSADEFSVSDAAELLSRQLLLRYGMICREIYELEPWPIPWRVLAETLIRLEWRGEIRRGFFIKGFSGMQFALPEAADWFRSYHQKMPGYACGEDSMILINVCDPANLYGAASPLPLLLPSRPGWRLLRHPHNYLIMNAGRPLLAIEGQGARLQPLPALRPADLEAVLSLLPQLLDDAVGARRIRSIRVEYWDQQPIRNSEIRNRLQALGFRDEFKAMVLEKPF